jgi:hypothetical protein
MPKLAQLIGQGNAFVAVGAAHLFDVPGNTTSVPSMLHQGDSPPRVMGQQRERPTNRKPKACNALDLA